MDAWLTPCNGGLGVGLVEATAVTVVVVVAAAVEAASRVHDRI